MAFIAEAVISRLREGKSPTEEEAEFLNRLPLIDELRDCVTRGDLAWLLPVIDQGSGEVAALHMSLLKRHCKDEGIQQRLRSRWESATPFVRAHLIWRLLDAPDLTPECHKRLFEFVLEEWPTFRDVSLKFLGAPETVVPQMLIRITDPTYLETKKWACLCRVPEAAHDREAAKALVTLGQLLSDPFAREVSTVLLKRFF